MLVFPTTKHNGDSGVGTIGDDAQHGITRALLLQEHRRHALEGRWYDNILFTYGQQGLRGRYDLAYKRPLHGRDAASSRHARSTYNITLRIVQDLIAALTQNPPVWKARPAKRDWTTRQGARAGQDVLDGATKLLDLESKRDELAYWLGPCGEAYFMVSWDFAAGRKIPTVGEDGNPVILSEGALLGKVIAPFSGYAHPQATCIDDSPWFGLRQIVSRSWLKRVFRDKWVEIDAAPSLGDSDQLWDASLLNIVPGSGPMRSVIGTSANIDHDESFVEFFSWYWRPDPEHPRGRLVYALGTKSEITHVLKDLDENPHVYFEDGEWKGGIPFVHFKALPIPGQFHSANIVDQVRDGQIEINRRQSQATALANATACAPLLVPGSFDSLAQKITNEPGRVYKGPDNLAWMPFYPRPPDIPAYAIKLTDDAMGLMKDIASPFGPQNDLSTSTSSGLHAAQVMEQMRDRIKPLVRSWENSWKKVGEMVLRNFQQFQAIEKTFQVKSEDGEWRKPRLMGSDLDDDIIVEVVQGSALPTSVVGTAALWIEFFKVGAADPNDPMTRRHFWNDVRWGDMADSFPDATADYDKANRNIGRALTGVITSPHPADNMQVHLSVYDGYRKSEEWERLPPPQQMAIDGLRQVYAEFQKMQIMAQMRLASVAAEQAEGEDSKNPVQASAAAIGPGAPQGGAGPTRSQGLGGMSEDHTNPGGNPR